MTMLDAIRPGCVIAVMVLASAASYSVDPPDVHVNTVSGLIETADATWSGSNFNIRYTEVTSAGQQVNSVLLSTNASNDNDPRIAVAPNGDVVVAWWRDLATDAVVFRKHLFDALAWSPEHPVGLASESGSHPRVIYAGDKPWVAYQIQNPKTRSVGVQIIDDDPEPIRAILATTGYGGNLDIQIQFESGHLWVTWVDSAASVGYAEYGFEKQLWSVPAQEPYSTDSVSAARSRVRNRLLGL
jgi:hypothetical protein